MKTFTVIDKINSKGGKSNCVIVTETGGIGPFHRTLVCDIEVGDTCSWDGSDIYTLKLVKSAKLDIPAPIDGLREAYEAARIKWLDFLRTNPENDPEIVEQRREAREIHALKKITHADMIRWGNLAVLAHLFRIEQEAWQEEKAILEKAMEDLREQLYLRDRKK